MHVQNTTGDIQKQRVANLDRPLEIPKSLMDQRIQGPEFIELHNNGGRFVIVTKNFGDVGMLSKMIVDGDFLLQQRVLMNDVSARDFRYTKHSLGSQN